MAISENNLFVEAVFNLDVNEFRRLLEEETFDKSLLSDICFCESMPCPIQWITQCWEVILKNPDEWREECRGIIAKKKEDNLEIRRLFEERMGVVFKPIDFYNTDFWFFRAERDASLEDVIWNVDRDEMIANGQRAIDLDLYVAVNKFDFKEVERLLKLGANPNHFIPEDGSDCYDRIGSECSFLSLKLNWVLLTKEHSNPLENNADDLIDLLGWGAHEMMYDLLFKYCKPHRENI